jgi:crossover junction endodeoxyribonuclease RusA
MITIHLDFPSRRLSPNSRGSWQSKLKDKEAAREAGFWRAKEAGEPGDLSGPLCAWITFSPPDRKRRDLDNLLASLKGQIDGISRAVEIDDSQIKRVVLEWGEPVKGGAVTIRLDRLESR